jgi:hypothetical protein
MGQSSQPHISCELAVKRASGLIAAAMQVCHTSLSSRGKDNTCQTACPSAESAASAQALHP